MIEDFDRDSISTDGSIRRPIHFHPTLAGIALAAIVFALYLPTFSHPFIFDDVPELVHNPDVLSLRGCLDTISRSQNTGLSGRPVACLSFAANVLAGGFSVRGFHLVNIAIHILATCTLFGILRRTVGRVQPAIPNFSTGAAGLIALLWAIHPLQTESVTYIIQRIESLAGLFYLLTLYCAIRSWNSSGFVLWSGLSVLCSALGMLTKEIVATAPLVVFLYDFVFVAQPRFATLRQRKYLYAGLAATWAIPVILLIDAPRSGTVGLGLGVSILDNLRTQAGVIVYYLRLCFWPFPQAISYSDWPIAREWLPALVPGAVVLIFLIISVVGLIRRQWWGFCGAWFFLILAPSSSFIPIVTEPAAERRMYLPLAAVICVVALSLFYVVRRIHITIQVRRATIVIFSVAIIIALGTATVLRNAQYATAEKILASTLAARPGDELVRGALVEELVNNQRMDEAGQIHNEGITRNPSSYILYDNWARAMSVIARYDDAIASFSKAIALRPDHYPARTGLGVALIAKGRNSEALSQLQEAVRLAPRSYSIHGNLAVALAHLNRPDEAIAELRIAIDLKPAYAEGHYNLARLLVGRGALNEAIDHFRIAAAVRPGDAEFRRALAEALQNQGGSNKASKP